MTDDFKNLDPKKLAEKFTLMSEVCDALDIARENGYNFKDKDEIIIAKDLILHNSSFENNSIDDLLPGIRIWKSNGNNSTH